MDIDGSLLALSLEEFRTAYGAEDTRLDKHPYPEEKDPHTFLRHHLDHDEMDIDLISDHNSQHSIETITDRLTPVHVGSHSTSTPLRDEPAPTGAKDPQKTPQNSHKHDDSIEIEAENSSFVSALSHTLFSPTNIGAKYAMKLLPPPEAKRDENVDYEYDTSLIKADFPTRHINSFSSSDNSVFLNDKEPEFVYNPAKNDYDEEIYNNNTMNRSYLFRRHDKKSESPTPANLPSSYNDLRDYTNLSREDLSEYTNFSGNLNQTAPYTPMVNMSQMSNLSQHTPTSVQVHHHYYYSPKDHPNPYVSPYKEYSLTNNETQYLTPLRSFDEIKLPPPWKQESSPKEKYSYIISTYLQLIINSTVSVYGVYLIYNIIKTIRADIDFKLLQQSRDLLVEISVCKRNYYDNNCSPDLIVPALEEPCEYWLKCMNQDPRDLGNKSSISAETLGLILNSLIEPLGFKFFMIFFLSIMMIFMFNFALGFIRAKSYYGPSM